jgi:hypothetical protein
MCQNVKSLSFLDNFYHIYESGLKQVNNNVKQRIPK